MLTATEGTGLVGRDLPPDRGTGPGQVRRVSLPEVTEDPTVRLITVEEEELVDT